MPSSKSQDTRKTQTLAIFLYTCNKQMDTEMKNTISFAIIQNSMAHLGLNPTKHVQGLYACLKLQNANESIQKDL